MAINYHSIGFITLAPGLAQKYQTSLKNKAGRNPSIFKQRQWLRNLFL